MRERSAILGRMTSFARSRLPLALVSALLAGGCAQNAILELQIELPPAPAGSSARFAYVQVASPNSGFDFGVDWGDEGFTVPLTDSSQWTCVSVVGASPEVDVNARVRFCQEERCLDVADGNAPESRIFVQDPLYIGRRTFVRRRILRVPECVEDADCGGFGRCTSGRCGCSGDADCTAEDAVCLAGGCVDRVGRCDVEGCITGATDNFCADDGSHFCERLDAEPLSYECELSE